MDQRLFMLVSIAAVIVLTIIVSIPLTMILKNLEPIFVSLFSGVLVSAIYHLASFYFGDPDSTLVFSFVWVAIWSWWGALFITKYVSKKSWLHNRVRR